MDTLQTLCKAYLDGSISLSQEKQLASLLISTNGTQPLSPEEEDCLMLLALSARIKKTRTARLRKNLWKGIAASITTLIIVGATIFTYRQSATFSSSMVSHAVIDGKKTLDRATIMNLVNSQFEEAGEAMMTFDADMEQMFKELPSFD